MKKREGQLSMLSLSRLAELVNAYIENLSKEFSLNKKGELDDDVGKNFFERLFGSEKNRMDFMELTKAIITKLLVAKGNIPYVVQLCDDAIKILLQLNERDKVIDKLFLAHLVDEQPQNQRNEKQQNQDVNVKISQKDSAPQSHIIAMMQPRQDQRQLNRDVATLLNLFRGRTIFGNNE
jgi:hypothetical protein